MGLRLLQPRIFQRVCREVLELPENAPPCDMREMNDDDEEAMVEYINDVSSDLFKLLFNRKLPLGRAEQNKLLRKAAELLNDGARADETITIYGNIVPQPLTKS